MWIDPNEFAKSINEKWLQMCNAGVDDGLKELREHLIYYHYYNERDGFVNTILTTVIHVNHKKKD